MSLRDLIRGVLSTAQELAAEEVTYRRGVQSAVLKMFPAAAAFPSDPVRGLAIEPQVKTWQIPTDQLLLNDVPICPRRGDLIEHQQDGQTLIYEVLPIAEQPYRIDPTGSLISIDTKLKSRT